MIKMFDTSKLLMEFPTLGHRIIYAYLIGYPKFVPVNHEVVSIESQKQMYDFLYETVKILYENPEIINIQPELDDFYENYKLSNSRPELIEKMRGIEYNFFDFYGLLYKIGQALEQDQTSWFIDKSVLKITKKTMQKLEKFEIFCDDNSDIIRINHRRYKDIFPAWKLHTQTNNEGLIKRQIMAKFLQGKMDDKIYQTSDMFKTIISDSQDIIELEQMISEKGFHCMNDNLAVTWIKEFPGKKKSFMSVAYSWRDRKQMSLKIQIYNFRTLLLQYEVLEDDLKSVIFYSMKTCDNCGYCTQTDKSGTRQVMSTVRQYKEKSLLKCPLFPNLEWYDLDSNTITNIKKIFELSEQLD
jgi:hypothetical protein